MKVSSFGHKFDKLEQLIHHHIEPNADNHYRFQTTSGLTWKNTKILKEFEALAKSMEKHHDQLDLEEKKAIYRVLKTIKDLASDKIHHRYVIFSEQSHPVLQKRMEQVTSLLVRLGITRKSSEVKDDSHPVEQNLHQLKAHSKNLHPNEI